MFYGALGNFLDLDNDFVPSICMQMDKVWDFIHKNVCKNKDLEVGINIGPSY